MDSVFGQNLLSIWLLSTVKVVVTIFFGVLPILVDFSSVLQKSEDIYSEQEQILNNEPLTFDYIIVGGGTAGCVVANRLSANPANSVLLLERGGDPNIFTRIPALGSHLLALGSPELAYVHQTTAQEEACAVFGGKCPVVTGRNLGGSTNINILIHTRGSPQIFDSWAAIAGDDIWRYENVLPFFKKSEDYHGYYQPINTTYHAIGGPWYVGNTDREETSPAGDIFLNAAEAAGYPLIDINNGEEARNGGSIHFDYNIKQGKRWTTYDAFLQPILARPNLHVYRYSRVVKVNLDAANRAAGVSYIRNGKLQEAHAQKEVVLSAGTFGSAQLLMLSGIGPKLDLDAVGIPPIVDLPVGKMLIDHVFAPIVFSINRKLFFYPERDTGLGDIYNYATSQSGSLGKILSGAAAVFTKSSRVCADCPPDLELTYSSLAGTKLPSMDNGRDYFAMSSFVVTPKSFGDFKLSRGNPDDELLINPAYLTHSDDVVAIVEGSFPNCILHRFKIKDLQFDPLSGCQEFQSNATAYWTCYAKFYGQSGFHFVGTCRMAADATAVVDSQLRVLGMQGLRVVDASVMPVVPNAHTTTATVMIAQLGSSLILGEMKGTS